jgi:hypothetical protein
MKKSNLYIYLARLDRKGMKVVAAFPSAQKVHPTRVNDISSLNLSPELSGKISKEAYENRMSHEVYAESAESFNDLKASLERRGYSSLPTQQFTGYTNYSSVNDKVLVTKSSTMLRRNSDVRG